MFVALWYMKGYPTVRSARGYWRELGYKFTFRRVWAVIGVLGALCKEYFAIVAPLFMDVPTVFCPPLRPARPPTAAVSWQNYVEALGAAVVGAVDTFPWYEYAMKGRSKVQHQPKYASIVSKVRAGATQACAPSLNPCVQ